MIGRASKDSINICKNDSYSSTSHLHTLNPSKLSRQKIIVAKGDSGASSHFIQEDGQQCLSNIENCDGPTIQLPDASTLKVTKEGTLPFSNLLTKQGKTATIVPGLQSSSLISIPQLCDDGCNVLLDNKKLYAVKNNKLILTGTRNKHDRLWDIPLPYQYSMDTSTIQENNHTTKAMHAGLYNKHLPTAPTTKSDIIPQPSNNPSTEYDFTYQHLNNLIDDF